MLGPDTIRNISDVAAYQAAQEGNIPLVVWSDRDLHHIPFLGSYTPVGWRRATWADLGGITPRNSFGRSDDEATFMVDSSGWGGRGEFALTFDEAVAYARDLANTVDVDTTFGLGIRESGQFQVVLGVWVKDPESSGNPAPAEDDVTCEQCHTVHNDLEECDEAGLDRCIACGDVIDYCQGHGEIGDPAGYAILMNHDEGNHTDCNPAGCDLAGTIEPDAAMAPAPGQEGLPWE